MKTGAFIARRLSFKGSVAMVCIAVSFLVMIVAVSVSSGFRKEIRNGVSAIAGDIQLSPISMNYVSESDPIGTKPSYLSSLDSLGGIKSITPVIYRVGVVKQGTNIQGVMFKGEPSADSTALQVRIPSRLAELLEIGVGDKMLVYFISDRIKARRFTVKEVYPSILETEDQLIVFAALSDLQRLNGWDEDQASVLEVRLDENHQASPLLKEKTDRIGTIALMCASEEDDDLVVTNVEQKFPQLFDWLALIDFNVVFILILMTIVAGFNMISGLLILLFRSISTIGILKSMGMTDKGISEVFLRVSSALVLKGMLIGNALALMLCWLQNATHLLKLNPENYFVSFVPMSVNLPVILVADLLSYVVIMLLLWIPCLFIAKVDPAQTVRSA